MILELENKLDKKARDCTTYHQSEIRLCAKQFFGAQRKVVVIRIKKLTNDMEHLLLNLE